LNKKLKHFQIVFSFKQLKNNEQIKFHFQLQPLDIKILK